MSKQLSCYATLNEMGIAQQMYAADHEGILPDAREWAGKLSPYVRNAEVFRCPADYRIDPPRWEGDEISYAVSYAMSDACSGVNREKVVSPHDVPLVYDGATMAGGMDAVAFRHRDGAVCNYVDGHSIWRSGEEWSELWREPEVEDTGS